MLHFWDLYVVAYLGCNQIYSPSALNWVNKISPVTWRFLGSLVLSCLSIWLLSALPFMCILLSREISLCIRYTARLVLRPLCSLCLMMQPGSLRAAVSQCTFLLEAHSWSNALYIFPHITLEMAYFRGPFYKKQPYLRAGRTKCKLPFTVFPFTYYPFPWDSSRLRQSVACYQWKVFFSSSSYSQNFWGGAFSFLLCPHILLNSMCIWGWRDDKEMIFDIETCGWHKGDEYSKAREEKEWESDQETSKAVLNIGRGERWKKTETKILWISLS